MPAASRAAQPRPLSSPASFAVLIALAALLAGCETISGGKAAPVSTPSTSASSPAPAARYNLTGYSPAFKQGYADACASPRRRNAERMKSDNDYSMGWTDGSSVCRSR